MKYKLKTLKMTDFRSFKGCHTIDLSRYKGLTGIIGNNQNTGGQSGAGKSTIFLAIAFVFDMCPFSAKDLVNWDSDSMQVELTLESEQGFLTIGRGKHAFIKYGDKMIEGASAVKTNLPILLGINKEQLKILTYREQKNAGMFLQLTDKEIKEFLSVLLNINKVEEATEASKTLINKLEKELELFTSKVQMASDSLTKLQGLFKSTDFAIQDELPVKSVDPALDLTITNIKDQIAGLDKSLKAEQAKFDRTKLLQLQDDHRTAVEDLNRLKVNDQNSQKAIERQKLQLSSKVAELKSSAKLIAELMAKGQSVYNQIVKIESGTCPTCAQSWVANKVMIDAKRKELEEIATRIQSLKDAQEQLPTLENEMKGLSFLPNPDIPIVQSRLDALQSAIDAEVFEERQFALNSGNKIKQEKLTLESELIKLQSQRQLCEVEANNIRQNNLKIKESNTKKLKQKEEFEKLINKSLNELDALKAQKVLKQTELDTEKEFYEFNKTFLGKIFEEKLDQIAHEVNVILGSIPNTKHIVFKLNSEKLNSKGEAVLKVNPEIQINGKTVDLKAGASGGMYTSIDLAVDLAISRIVSQETGVNFDWLMLDEAFEGLDRVSKEIVLDLLKTYSHDKNIFVIDHMSETQELFDNIIEVKYQGSESQLNEKY